MPLLEAGQHFPRTDAAVLLAGWIPQQRASGGAPVGNHRRTVRRETSGPEHCPLKKFVLLRIRAGCVRLGCRLGHGLKYHELEPTLFVALGYVLMFGVMFGDAGMGRFSLGGLVAWFKARAKKLRDVGVLLSAGRRA
jgi:V/A-type H+-transporting ATPase subunit I